MSRASAPLKRTSVVGYGQGDAANNFVFAMGMLFLLNYCTDVAGIDAAAAGTLLVLVRIYDAAMDMVVGTVVDRTPTSTRRDRCRCCSSTSRGSRCLLPGAQRKNWLMPISLTRRANARA